MISRELVQQIKAESAKAAEETWGLGDQIQTRMIDNWREIRPKMVADLERQGILAEFAHLLLVRREETEDRYLAAGMGWPDSREQANLDWLINAPETEDAQAGDVEPLMAMAARVYLPLKVKQEAGRLRQNPPMPTI